MELIDLSEVVECKEPTTMIINKCVQCQFLIRGSVTSIGCVMSPDGFKQSVFVRNKCCLE